MKLQFIILLTLIFSFSGCKEYSEEDTKHDESTEVIEKAYVSSGSDRLNNAIIDFDFRDKHYSSDRQQGSHIFYRSYYDSIGQVEDKLINNEFTRTINGNLAQTPDSMASKYKESINSVHYFSVLPYGLKDEAVNSTYIGKIKINDKEYHKIKVHFDQEGGGQDFEDVFIYWINTETNFIDYLAYSFTVNDGGLRFREAYNERFIDGIRFLDYKNYKPKEDSVELIDLDQSFIKGTLELLSKIELNNITVNRTDVE